MDMEVGGTSVSDGEGCEESHSGSNGSRCEIGGSNNSGAGKLKRSSSAPMINQLLPQGNSSVTPSTSSK